MSNWKLVDGEAERELQMGIWDAEPNPNTGLVRFDWPQGEDDGNWLGNFEYNPALFRPERWNRGKDKTAWDYELRYIGPPDVSSLVIPEGVVDLSYTFAWCNEIVDASGIRLPSTLQRADGMFVGCESLRHGLKLPEGVEAENVYQNCRHMCKNADEAREMARVVHSSFIIK